MEATTSDWRGSTGFEVIVLGLALTLHGDLLPKDVRNKWQLPLPAAAQWIEEKFSFDPNFGNINYLMSVSLALYLTGEILNNNHYLQQAENFAKCAAKFFTEDYLIFGEGTPFKSRSARGCRFVDLGYNVEKTLPNLVLYAHLSGNEKLKKLCYQSLKAHAEFMLPNGT